jgi:hypothetical protein
MVPTLLIFLWKISKGGFINQILQYCFCRFQNHFSIFFLVILKTLLFLDKLSRCDSAEGIHMAQICKNILHTFPHHFGLSFISELYCSPCGTATCICLILGRAILKITKSLNWISLVIIILSIVFVTIKIAFSYPLEVNVTIFLSAKHIQNST